MDMRFYWIRDRITQKHFVVQWHPGKMNLGDYYTKHHASKHHQSVHSTYLHEHDSPTSIPTEIPTGLRGCVENTGRQVSKKPTTKLNIQTYGNHSTRASQVRLAINRYKTATIQKANAKSQPHKQ